MQTKVMQIKVLRKLLKPLCLIGTAVGALFIETVFAAPGTSGIALSDLSKNVDSTVGQLATVLSDIAIISGVGFVLASFFKFHQHKLNPTNVQLSQGITLLLIGAGLVLFPTMLPTTKRAVFGTQATISKVGGSDIHNIIGSK